MGDVQSEGTDCDAGKVSRVTKLPDCIQSELHAVFATQLWNQLKTQPRSRLSVINESDIFDIVVSQLRKGFESLEKLKILELLNLDKFS